MKERNVSVTKSRFQNPETQCIGKKKYKLKRRAVNDARTLAHNNPDMIFSAYECPHCGWYHVGRVRVE